jgi:Effector Associated Constant Component 1
MNVQLWVPDDPGGEALHDLLQWLRQEPELRGLVRPGWRGPAENELGGGLDALTVAVSSGGAITILVASLERWLARPRGSDVRISVRAENGNTLEVDAKNVRDVPALVAEITDLAAGQ